MSLLAKCEKLDCIQTDCGRLESNGCMGFPHAMHIICCEGNGWMWYDGKQRKDIVILDGLYETNTNGHEDVENVSDERKSL